MPDTRHKQQGAALVVVLSLLSMALMLGISAMSGSLVNERLAGNYRAAVMAQNEAEAGLYAFNDELRAAIEAINNTETPAPPVYAGQGNGFVAALRSAAAQARHEQSSDPFQDALSGSWSQQATFRITVATAGGLSQRCLKTMPCWVANLG
jgi:Tfp pilus assembly protein PilX